MTRQEIFDFVRKEYGMELEYPWLDRNAMLLRNVEIADRGF